MSTFDKIKSGLKEAVAFARGTCHHEWDERKTEQKFLRQQGLVAISETCKRCGVRITKFNKILKS